MRVLVIGGNRYVGKRLVRLLEQGGAELVVVNRHAGVDRRDERQLAAVVGARRFDAVFDFACLQPDEAAAACRVFAGKTARYVFISSQSVYDTGLVKASEAAFDAAAYPPKDGNALDYREAKRQAERVFATQAPFPCIAIRFPIILGPDDYSGRLEFHVRRIARGEPIHFPALDAALSFVGSDFAAEALRALPATATGALNVASPEPVVLRTLVGWIEQRVGRPLIQTQSTEDDVHSPFGVDRPWGLDTTRAQSLGLRLPALEAWLPALIEKMSLGAGPVRS